MLCHLMTDVGCRVLYLPDMSALRVSVYQLSRLLYDFHRCVMPSCLGELVPAGLMPVNIVLDAVSSEIVTVCTRLAGAILRSKFWCKSQLFLKSNFQTKTIFLNTHFFQEGL